MTGQFTFLNSGNEINDQQKDELFGLLMANLDVVRDKGKSAKWPEMKKRIDKLGIPKSLSQLKKYWREAVGSVVKCVKSEMGTIDHLTNHQIKVYQILQACEQQYGVNDRLADKPQDVILNSAKEHNPLNSVENVEQPAKKVMRLDANANNSDLHQSHVIKGSENQSAAPVDSSAPVADQANLIVAANQKVFKVINSNKISLLNIENANSQTKPVKSLVMQPHPDLRKCGPVQINFETPGSHDRGSVTNAAVASFPQSVPQVIQSRIAGNAHTTNALNTGSGNAKCDRVTVCGKQTELTTKQVLPQKSSLQIQQQPISNQLRPPSETSNDRLQRVIR